MNKFSLTGKSSFDRGDVFVATADKSDGNIYVLVRESRPSDGMYCYNLLNLETGKMRFTDGDRAFWTNEPIPADQIANRFNIALYHVCSIGDTVPLIRDFLQDTIEEDMIDMREVALDSLTNR